jgi:hypothetical protein
MFIPSLADQIEAMTHDNREERQRVCMEHFQDEGICSHQQLFIHGYFHSGTSLAHVLIPDILTSADHIKGTGTAEDEAQKLTKVTRVMPMGSNNCDFMLYKDQPNPKFPDVVTREMSVSTFYEWAPYWDLSKEILVSKEPIWFPMGLKNQLFPGISIALVISIWIILPE